MRLAGTRALAHSDALVSAEHADDVISPSAYLWGMTMTQAPAQNPTQTGDVTITAAAAARVAAIAAKQGKPAILRLAVDGGGCSGFQYKFGMADDVAEDDSVAECDGVKLVVDAMSLDLVRGCSVDFVETLGGTAFRVENPQAASGCGCGSSFAV